MAGQNEVHAIYRYYCVNQDKLKDLIYGLDGSRPHPQTIRRILTVINTDDLFELLKEFFSYHDSLCHKHNADQSISINESISCDANTVQIYSSKYGLALGLKMSEKTGLESQAMRDMLAFFNTRNSIIAWDSIDTSAATMDAVITSGADFICSLKHNYQFKIADMSYVLAHAADFDLINSRSERDLDDCKEISEFYFMRADQALCKETLRKFKHIKSFICTRKSVLNPSLHSNVVSYDNYVSSIDIDYDDQSLAEQLKDLITSCNHEYHDNFSINVCFDQDRLPLRNRDYIANTMSFAKMTKKILTFAQKSISEHTGKTPPSIRSLQNACNDIDCAFILLKSYVKEDKASIMNIPALYSYGLIKKEEPEIIDNYKPKVKEPKNRLEAIAMYGSKRAKELGF